MTAFFNFIRGKLETKTPAWVKEFLALSSKITMIALLYNVIVEKC